MIAIVDYGVGNLFSLGSSFKAIGEEAVVTRDPDAISGADGIILPGVGAFSDAIGKLRSTGLDETLKNAARDGKKILGICLGMQLLFENSLEYGDHKGLGLLPGVVRPLSGYVPAGLKIPHIGWNALKMTRASKMFKYSSDGEYVYFVHSYYADAPSGTVTAVSEYGRDVTASVEEGSVYGLQFHPEKSGVAGLKMLKAFCEI
ncbi:MAG: imidazole glycerol phosphate synthase subunit HisH [Clostridia bacterium]|nr:imidazole glycerol phosphate synthase subunit HisH [Clostridia bacterium]